MTIVERVVKESELPDRRARLAATPDARVEDSLARTRRTDGGVEFGTSPRAGRAPRLRLAMLDEERLVVAIVERAEPVFVIEPRTPPEWALFAYHIGNRHQPLMITDRSLVCPDVPGVEQLLQQHHMPYERATVPFTPAATVAGHQH